jgi:hypothetical protein
MSKNQIYKIPAKSVSSTDKVAMNNIVKRIMELIKEKHS